MGDALADPSLPLDYSAPHREYFLEYQDGGSSVQQILFCPFCGARLPQPLYAAWLDAVRADGFEPLEDALPERFRSDTWWRDAGL